MDRTARILVTGVVTGLMISIWGTLMRLILTPLAVNAGSLFKTQNVQTVLLSCVLDIIVGFLLVFAYILYQRAAPSAMWKKVVSFSGIVILAGVLPRVVAIYKYFPTGNKILISWAAAWSLEAILAVFLVVLLYPRKKGEAPPARA